MVNLELALPHFREAVRIFEAINHVDNVNSSLRLVADTEENKRQIGVLRATAATTATTATATSV